MELWVRGNVADPGMWSTLAAHARRWRHAMLTVQTWAQTVDALTRAVLRRLYGMPQHELMTCPAGRCAEISLRSQPPRASFSVGQPRRPSS